MPNFFKLMTLSLMILFAFVNVAEAASVHAHLASPDKYEVLLENEQVLVLRMTLKPGEQDKWHKHNAETVYFEAGGKVKITTRKGANTLDIADGFTMWHESWEHQVTNIGDNTITAIIVEQK
ncbi:hypothetical protein RI845_10905 [Thalassotalea nanhaiensis]|uniref:Cupin domain-containing protein n=1 Tax=Thalassotalea nanhaiensis TaxID=3065648 RepID=A0ABY9TE03_9GAMM|nr:hypothetical protein RI845_10905 [Colwelliaceae bacterium SQ345]